MLTLETLDGGCWGALRGTGGTALEDAEIRQTARKTPDLLVYHHHQMKTVVKVEKVLSPLSSWINMSPLPSVDIESNIKVFFLRPEFRCLLRSIENENRLMFKLLCDIQ